MNLKITYTSKKWFSFGGYRKIPLSMWFKEQELRFNLDPHEG